MAFDLSKLNIFKRLSARSRVFVLFGAVIGAIFLVYLATSMFAGDGSAVGPSRVAGPPPGLQSIPGGEQSPEFSQAVEQASAQRAQEAQITGESAVPTLVRIGQQPELGGSPCIICSDQAANVGTSLNEWVKQGSISKEVAQQLNELAAKNVSVDEYAQQLDALVKAGKLTPAQARELLETYKKQHASSLLQDSEKIIDQMIKTGQVPLSVANELLELQKKGVSPSDYAARLQQLVREGKLSPAAAQKLLAQYTQQRAKEIVEISVSSLRKMAKEGQITPDVEKELIELEIRMVALNVYEAKLKSFVDSGKMTPVVSQKILDEFKWQKSAIGPSSSIDNLVELAEKAAEDELVQLLGEGKINLETANMIRDLIKRDVTMDNFKSIISQLVQKNQLTPDIAKLKIADYQAIRGYRDLAQQLTGLQANNVSPNEYAEALKQAVQAGIISPEEATRLMQEYQALTAKVQAPAAQAAGPGNAEFAKLQQRLQQKGAPQQTPTFEPGEFAASDQQVSVEDQNMQIERLQNLMAAMSGQAQQLIASWQPPNMASKVGSVSKEKSTGTTDGAKEASKEGGEAAGEAGSMAAGPSLVKAGSILFAVLDTGVNSDYPDSPVMATIVDGKYKGAKLLGKLITTKGVAGQLDRVSLNFTLMNMDDWPKSKPITAYAIDPDTARTVLASSVNYHYMQRFGAIMATSFLQGYANAVSSSSSTSTTGIFGTSTTHPELSPGNKLAMGIGQIGQALGNVTQNYVNIPPTVRVDSGVGLGILFMSDVS